MKTIKEVLQSNTGGLHYGNRILLPFKCDVLKAIFENEIVTDFSLSNVGAEYNIRDSFTEIYFHGKDELSKLVSKYKGVKLLVVEKNDDIFDPSQHQKLVVYFEDKHHLKIELAEDDILFFE